MVIKWSDFAKNNLQDFIKNSKMSEPVNYVENLVESVKLLEDNPEAGKILFYDKKIAVRQLIHDQHRILYRISKDEIHIGSVINTAQNLEQSLKYINKFFK